MVTRISAGLGLQGTENRPRCRLDDASQPAVGRSICLRTRTRVFRVGLWSLDDQHPTRNEHHVRLADGRLPG